MAVSGNYLKKQMMKVQKIFSKMKLADSHLGLMLNLDWFQPYDGTIYSIGVIYAAICNLPCNIRFKRKLTDSWNFTQTK